MPLNNHVISLYVCHIISIHVTSLSAVNILKLLLVTIPCVVTLHASVPRDLLPNTQEAEPQTPPRLASPGALTMQPGI